MTCTVKKTNGKEEMVHIGNLKKKMIKEQQLRKIDLPLLPVLKKRNRTWVRQ